MQQGPLTHESSVLLLAGSLMHEHNGFALVSTTPEGHAASFTHVL